MILRVFSVRDTAADAFMPPFFERATGAALRAFEAAVNDPQHVFHRSPADFILYEIGHFDDDTGSLEAIQHVQLGRAIDLVRSNPGGSAG